MKAYGMALLATYYILHEAWVAIQSMMQQGWLGCHRGTVGTMPGKTAKCLAKM
jgi:hypothetical protein